jgi:hypothetical protein
MKIRIKGVALLLALILIFTGQITALAAEDQTSAAIKDTAAYIHQMVKSPKIDSVGGEWAIIGLARSGYDVPDSYYEGYYRTVEASVKAANGILHDKKYTEYSRVILALTAAGYDPTDVVGYDLTMALGDFEKTIWQGINGPIFALIALDSGNYSIPKNSNAAVQATRAMYVDEILQRQLSDGGFSLFGGSEDATNADYQADPDITAMALQALAKYQDRADVKKVTEEALACLSKLQNNQGGYASWNEDNVESVAQVIVALTELGIPLDDPRFVKNGKTLVDNLLTFYVKGQGFRHTASGGGSNQMATEQAFYALVAAQRVQGGKSSLYRMTDTIQSEVPPQENIGIGLPGKHADVKAMTLTYPGKTFDDISSHSARSSIEALAERGIISGKTEKAFDADATMTRAEFATIIVRGLGLSGKAIDVFADVPANSWYAGAVGSAYSYGIVAGTTPTTFNPNGSITREEAAAMVARAAKLTGMETSMTDSEVRDTLAQFADYTSSSGWARPSLAFCYREDILSQEDIDIRPKAAIKRYEVAEMLFYMLEAANLL